MQGVDATNSYNYYETVKLKRFIASSKLEGIDNYGHIDKVCFASPPYSLRYMMHLHRTLFSDIYEQAGEVRSVNVSKGGIYYCNYRKIIVETDKLFSRLKRDKWLVSFDKETFCERLAEYYCDFNMIHPFREGNGRVQRIMFEHLVISAGYDVDWKGVGQQEWIQANIDGVGIDYELATEIFKRIVSIRLRSFGKNCYRRKRLP